MVCVYREEDLLKAALMPPEGCFRRHVYAGGKRRKEPGQTMIGRRSRQMVLTGEVAVPGPTNFCRPNFEDAWGNPPRPIDFVRSDHWWGFLVGKVRRHQLPKGPGGGRTSDIFLTKGAPWAIKSASPIFARFKKGKL